MTKYIFVTGGVVSSLGKGITAASLARLLKNRGLNVTIQKFDPYINIDPGTMSPYQHGEVFVTDDGAETDLDLGSLVTDCSDCWPQAVSSVRANTRPNTKFFLIALSPAESDQPVSIASRQRKTRAQS